MDSDPVFYIVIDTNIVLDLFVFDDQASQPLRQALLGGQLRWIATQAMRDELERVLAYPHIVPRLAFYGLTAGHVLVQFDALAQREPAAQKAPLRCSDTDDQKFIDLAIAHKTVLVSKDRAVLAMKKRLAAMGVRVQKQCAVDHARQLRI